MEASTLLIIAGLAAACFFAFLALKAYNRR